MNANQMLYELEPLDRSGRRAFVCVHVLYKPSGTCISIALCSSLST